MRRKQQGADLATVRSLVEKAKVAKKKIGLKMIEKNNPHSLATRLHTR